MRRDLQRRQGQCLVDRSMRGRTALTILGRESRRFLRALASVGERAKRSGLMMAPMTEILPSTYAQMSA